MKPLKDELFSRIIPQGVSQLVTEGTRISPSGTLSGLDHIYTNKPDKCSQAFVENFGGSDHKLIRITRFTKAEVRKPKFVTKRCFKNFETELFLADVANMSWLDIYLCEDTEEATRLLTMKLTGSLDKFAPIKIIQVHKNYAHWISNELKLIMKRRDEAFAQASQSQCPNDRLAYKKPSQ